MANAPITDYSLLKMLIIEDEAHTRSIIRSQLLQIGVREIAEAADGKAGSIETMRIKPHIILCDVHMAPVNGLEFLATLRASKLAAIRDTPVVFLTADAQKDTVLFAKAHNVSGYLVKPVSAAQLKERIDSISPGIQIEQAPAPLAGNHYQFPRRDP